VDNQGNAAVSSPLTTPKYDVTIVDTDPRLRMKFMMELATLAVAASFESLDALTERAAIGDRPMVVVLGPSFAQPLALERVQRTLQAGGPIAWILVTEKLSTEIMQSAIRAGARDVLEVDTSELQLKSSVSRVGEVMVSVIHDRPVAAPVVTKRGRLIVSFSTKGGVGKSMVATNLAIALAKKSPLPVAIVDCDLQFGDVAVLLGIPPQHTVVEAAAAIATADTQLMANLLTKHEPSGLLVLPAPVEPSAADQIRPEDMLQICSLLQDMCGYVVVDMPPHFDDLVLTMLEAADDVLLVASLDIPSIKNLKVGMQTLDLLSLAGDKLRLVLNRANTNVKLEISEVEKALGIPAEFPIPSDIAVPQSVNRGVPVVLDQPKSPAAKAMLHMADVFIERNEHGDEEPTNEESGGRRKRRRKE
jgi:pilus assembly protein CpaE